MKILISTVIVVLTSFVSYGQRGYYASLGFTQVPFNMGGSVGLSYTYKRNVVSFNIKEYKEYIEEIVFVREKPNRVVYNIIYQVEYGYLAAFDKKEIFCFLPALGLGYNYGKWRTDEQIPGSGSGWFFPSPKYETRSITGFCFTPQVEFLIRARFIGLGFGATFNIVPANNLYNTQNVFVRVLFGNINKLDKSDKRPSVGK